MTGVHDLSPREFEDLSVEYLWSKGLSDVRRVGQAGDLGVDIRCKDDIGRLVVAQCKRYRAEAKIGSPEIQTFFGMTARARAARGVFITASSFTDPARRLAYELDIELVDGSQIGAFYQEKIRSQQEAERQRQIEAARQRELVEYSVSARDWSQPAYASRLATQSEPMIIDKATTQVHEDLWIPGDLPPGYSKLEMAAVLPQSLTVSAAYFLSRLADETSQLGIVFALAWFASEITQSIAINEWILRREVTNRTRFEEYRVAITYWSVIALAGLAGWSRYRDWWDFTFLGFFSGMLIAIWWYFSESHRSHPIDAEATKQLRQSGMSGLNAHGWPEWYSYWQYLNLALAIIVGVLLLQSW